MFNLFKSGQVYRIITYQFLHVDLVHISFNMITLIIIGSLVEHVLTPVKYFSMFLINGIGAGLFYLMIEKDGETIGASGSIYGLLGAYVRIY